MRKKLRKIKKIIYSHQFDTIVILISLILCIIGVILINWYVLPIILIIDLIYFYRATLKKYFIKVFKLKNKVNKEKIIEEVAIEEGNTEDNNVEKDNIEEVIKENIKVEGSSSKMVKKTKTKVKETKIKKKHTKTPKEKKRKRWKNILKIFLLIMLIGIILLFIGACAFWMYIVKVSPKFSEDNLYKKESTILYDKDGEVFAELGSEFREKITYDQLPEVLVNAIIATEDSRFFQHNGFDLPRFIKASIGQVLKKVLGVGGNAGGASTLTMQIAKNAFNGTEDEGVEGIVRKFKDIYVAVNEIEKNYTKEQIIEFYANSYLLGGNIYGVEKASLYYFGKSAKDLNLSEAAIIAGLYQSPNAYNPVRNPENAAYRRKIVLSLMVRHGYITQTEADIANAIPIEDLVIDSSSSDNIYQGFIDTVVAEIKDDTNKNAYTTSMEIYTTLDRSKQDVVNAAMNGETFRWENDLVDAGVSVIDTKTGEIAAVGIGRNTSQIGLRNNATFRGLIKPQIGSTAKPLYDYGPAVEYNNMSPYNYVGDEPYSYTNGPDIANWDGAFQSLITARQALVGSRNVPALKVFQQVKNRNILEFVTNLGLSPEIESGTVHEAHAIGGYNGESPMTVAAAYAAFANGGVYNEPHSYRKIVYRDTGEEVEKEYISRTAMKDSTAFIIYDMLVSTSLDAMRGYSNINNWKYAAKTGTTNFTEETKTANGLASDAINDLWCTAVTDEYSISVWYGYDKIYKDAYSHFLNSNHIILLRTIASQVWTRSNMVTQPSSVVRVQVEAGNVDEAKLPSKYTPADQITTEYFVKGSEPTEVSTRFTQLSNVKNLKGSYSSGVVTLTWDKIETPDGLDKEYLRKYMSKVFTNDSWLEDAVRNRYNYYSLNLGGIVYNIYQRVGDELELIATTDEEEIEIEITSTASNPTYVVKTSWANHSVCDSSGTLTTVDVSKSSAILTVRLIGDSTVTITKGSSYTTSVKVFENNIDVTSNSTIKFSIVDSVGQEVATSLTDISSLDSGTYKIKYTATCNKLTKSISRTLIIE